MEAMYVLTNTIPSQMVSAESAYKTFQATYTRMLNRALTQQSKFPPCLFSRLTSLNRLFYGVFDCLVTKGGIAGKKMSAAIR
jgi:hypothetical protein